MDCSNQIGYILTGGIGDCILSIPIIKKLNNIFNTKINVLFFTKASLPILQTLDYCIPKYSDIDLSLDYKKIYEELNFCDLIVWNRFEKDNDGFSNFFYAKNEKFIDFVREKRNLYLKNLSEVVGREIKDVKHTFPSVVPFLNLESNYYVDWNRFGLDIKYKDLDIEVPKSIKNSEFIDKIDNLCIFHDSRLEELDRSYSVKSWDRDKWEDLVVRLKKKFFIVHFNNINQTPFFGSTSIFKLLGGNPNFFDYLYLLDRAKLYIGTDSWPAHAAIFLKNTKFILLKGAVSKRWDHNKKFSDIIRKGKCNCCEYISLETCIFDKGMKRCMKSILVEDVLEKVVNI